MNEQETLAMVPATIVETHEPGELPGLTVTVDLSSLGVPGKWEYDSVIDVDPNGGEVTLLCYPPADDPCWD